MKKLRHLLEYAAALFGFFLLDRISASAAERVAINIADAWYFLDRSHRQTAQDNVLLSGITSSRSEAARIARDSFRHFGVLVTESLKAKSIFSENNWKERIEMEVDPSTMDILQKPGQGLILASGHLGNWEVAAQLISFIKPVAGITRKMNNPHTDRLIKERKPWNRFRLTPKHEAGIERLLSVLKSGEILAILIDQNAKGRGMQINFFGTPASTFTSPALLHLITRTPLCFGYCIRKGPMSYKFVAHAPVTHGATGNRENDVRTILDKLTHELETAIKKYPEQYLWAHGRWKA